MKRFDWPEMMEYWRTHSRIWGKIDYSLDPSGLGNVCHAGAPLWLNQYYAHFQKMVYKKLLALLPALTSGARALDVGCGAARWCEFLSSQEYKTVGIDLQPDLIRANKSIYPNIDFYCASIQEFDSEVLFDLVSCVTVIQHIPFKEQYIAVRKIRELLKENGHAIVLENVHDQAPHVFSHTIEEWQKMFESSGFRCKKIWRYDYSPFLRVYSLLKNTIRKILLKHMEATNSFTFLNQRNQLGRPDEIRKLLYILNISLLRMALQVDKGIEPICVHNNFRMPTVHCGFLFQAR